MSKAITKQKKRKPWPSCKYWSVYFAENKDLWLNGQRTINHTFAAKLMQYDEFENDDEKGGKIDMFARMLDRGRNEGLNKLRLAGMEIFVVGEGRIEGITKDPAYRDEHNRRLARMLDVKKLATFIKAHGATLVQQRLWGLPLASEIKNTKRRLLEGDSEMPKALP